MKRHTLGLAVIVGAGLACAGRAASSRTPAEAPGPAITAPLSMAMLGAGEGGVGNSDMLDRLFDTPAVTQAGERLLDRLSTAPELEPQYEQFLAGLLEQPALMQAFAAVAAEQPGVSPEALTERVVARLSEGVDGPEFDAALDGALERLLDRPPVDEAFARMAEALVERSRLAERLSALLRSWQPDLEAAVGVPMTDERFEDRFMAHLFEPGRTHALGVLVSERLVVDPAIPQSFAALLADDAFFAACASLVASMLSSPGFDERATAVFAGLIEKVDAAELERRVDRALVTPELERAVAVWADTVIKAESFGQVADRLGAVLDDPNVQAELFSVLVGPSPRPTA